MIYVGLTATLFLQSLLALISPRKFIIATGVLVIALFAAIAGLRGTVGTDTYAYFMMVKLHLMGAPLRLEPGFLFLIQQLGQWVKDPAVVLNLCSTVFFVAALVFLYRATRNEIIYLFAFFAPQYFINYSMNGIRIGLASIFFLLFYQSWVRNDRKTAAAFAAIAFSFHYSILMAFALFFIKPSSKTAIRSLVWRALALACVVGVAALQQSYLIGKIDRYIDLPAFDSLAGLSGLIKISAFLLFVWYLPIPRFHTIVLVGMSLFLMIASMVIVQVSYAGLRIMDISVWIIPLLFLSSMPPGQETGRAFTIGLMASGLLGALGVIRNLYSSVDIGLSPFLPYVFIWENSFQ